MQKRISVTSDSIRCSSCMLNEVCLPLGMPRYEMERLDELVKERIRIPKGSVLYKPEDSVEGIYGLRSGSLKTQLEDAKGHIHITGFFLPGEILGMDSLHDDVHRSHAIALEDSEVCVISLDDMDRLSKHLPILQQQFRRLMSKEINRAHHLMLTLAGLRSEQRLAAFLLNLSQRLSLLGYSPYEFILRMSREEIGNFLGLTLETISRLFSRFAREGLLKISQREVHLLDLNGLHILAGTDCNA